MTKTLANDWQEQLKNAVRDAQVLFKQLELDPALLSKERLDIAHFPLRVPQSFINRMRKGDINDPLLKQVLPVKDELMQVPGYNIDPLTEKKFHPVPGLLHKYYGRVLLVMTGACAVHCRYCFRQHFDYNDSRVFKNGMQPILDYIKKDTTIAEVILSGGDPLTIKDEILARFVEQLAQIPHVKRLRLHTRMPIVLPARINTTLLDWIRSTRLQVVMIMHANHPQELSTEIKLAVDGLRDAGVHVFNQAVLLKGINDDVETLVELSVRLFAAGIIPYYLFTLDKVMGAAHFDAPFERVQQLHWELTKRLPGYLVPKLAMEIPGKGAKVTRMDYASTSN